MILLFLLLLVGCDASVAPESPEALCRAWWAPYPPARYVCEHCKFSEDRSMLCCPETGNSYEPARGRTPEKGFPDGTETVQQRIVRAFPVSGGDHSIQGEMHDVAKQAMGWVLQPTPKSLDPKDWGCPNWTPGT